MRGGTLFSGIGAPECADPGIDWRWAAEIDPFASAVYRERFPGVPNLGDVTTVDWQGVEKVDVLIFGSPCQSFSVAGRRHGLDDPRGHLASIALGVVQCLRPRWFVFENVPGLLSSGAGRDFGALLGQMGECGYGVAWRVLDARHFGVPQRRRRLFVIGYLGDWRPAAAVLFESESLRRPVAPRRQAPEAAAGTVADGARSRGGTSLDGGAMIAFGGNNTSGPIEIATAVNAHGGPHGRLDFESETFVVHALRGEGFDGSEDGTGRETPQVPVSNRGGGARVRRLTPKECERLMAFPDGWTDVPWRGRSAPDGRRLKALGNSMVVTVIGWVLERLARVDRMLEEIKTVRSSVALGNQAVEFGAAAGTGAAVGDRGVPGLRPLGAAVSVCLDREFVVAGAAPAVPAIDAVGFHRSLLSVR